MEPDLTELVWKAASTVVTLLATDGWEKAKRALGSLWRRADPEKADALEAELAQTRDKILAARIQGDAMIDQVVIRELEGRLGRLLADFPWLETEMRRLLAEELSDAGRDRKHAITQRARSSGTSRVYQAGRDQHIHES